MVAVGVEQAPQAGEPGRPGRGADLRAIAHRLFEPIDIASLAYFRIAFGVLFMIEIWRFFSNRWIARYYIDPSFNFTYFGFDWVRPWPGAGMYVHFIALFVLSGMIALGLWYRLSATLLFFGFIYVFLLEQARYLNHFYLMGLISLLMIFVPANRAWSLDARLRPSISSSVAPAWSLWILRAQIGVPYFFGGVAKLNPDWLQGEPMRTWLRNRDDWPVLGPIAHLESTVAFFTYGGLLLDLFAVPMLLWSRTRPFALVATFMFHLLNAWMFRIGIFPWFMMAATLLFLPPHWPRVVFGWVTGRAWTPPIRDEPREQALTGRQRLVVGVLAAYAIGQLVVPLRHHLYPGEAIWTEEGSMFSWHMMLRHKPAQLQFMATDPRTGQSWEVDALRYVKRWQFDEMDRRPDLILQLSHHIAADLRRQGVENVEIRVRAMAALNGRRSQPLIDPSVDLAAQQRVLWPPSSWIVPLTEPLRPRRSQPRAS